MPMNRSMIAFLAAGALLRVGTRAEPLVLRYTLNVENPTQTVLSEAGLWVYAPMAAETLEASHPYELETDAWGNRILRFEFKTLAPFQQIPVRIEARIEASPVLSEYRDPSTALGMTVGKNRAVEPANASSPSMVMPTAVEASPVLSEYRDSPSLWLESSDPLYRLDPADLAARAPAFDAESPLDRARQIHDWVARHLRYTGYDPTDRGAAYALRHGQGDCTESMALMVALCRHNGIPARGAGGYRLDRSGIVRAADYHNWAVLLIDDAVWIADPLKRVFQEAGTPYVMLSWVGEIGNALQGYPRFRHDHPNLSVTMQ